MTPAEEKAFFEKIERDNVLGMEARLGQAELAGRIRFLVEKVRTLGKAARHYRDLATADNDRAKNYAANAAILLGDERFQRFIDLRSKARLTRRDKTNCDMALKAMLGIASKSELNTDAAAAERWRQLVKDFNEELRRGV